MTTEQTDPFLLELENWIDTSEPVSDIELGCPTNNDLIIQTDTEHSEPSTESPIKDAHANDAEHFLEWLDLPCYTFCWSKNFAFSGDAKTLNLDRAIKFCSAANRDEAVTAVWVHCNPATDDAPANAKLKNASIIERKHLVLDLDPNKDYSPTAEDKELVSAFTNDLLISFGFEGIATLDSGNGVLQLAKITAPVKDDWDGRNGFIQRFYNYLNEQLSANGFDRWSADAQCKDAARIVGVAGTWNHKEEKGRKQRKLMRLMIGAPMTAEKFIELVDRVAPIQQRTINQPIKREDSVVSTTKGTDESNLFWALWFQRFGEDGLSATQAALIEAGFTVIGPDNSGEGILFESAYRSDYTTPFQDTDCCVYPGMGYCFVHSTDNQNYEWDGAIDFASQHLPVFWAEYQAELLKYQNRVIPTEPNMAAWEFVESTSSSTTIEKLIITDAHYPEFITSTRNSFLQKYDKNKRLHGGGSCLIECIYRNLAGKHIMIDGAYVGSGLTLIGGMSGEGKTPLLKIGKKLHKSLGGDAHYTNTDKSTMQALIKTIARTRGTIEGSGKSETMKLYAEYISTKDLKSYLIIPDECEENLGQLMGHWGEQPDLGRLIELLTSESTIGNDAVTTGKFNIQDNANMYLGFIQPSSYTHKLKAYGEANKSKGISARLIYRPSKAFNCYDDINTHDVINNILNWKAKDALDKLTAGDYRFIAAIEGVPAIERLREIPELQPFMEQETELFNSCAPKIVERAMQSAALSTYINNYKTILEPVGKPKIDIDSWEVSGNEAMTEEEKIEAYAKSLAVGEDARTPDFIVDDSILEKFLFIAAADLVNSYLEYMDNLHVDYTGKILNCLAMKQDGMYKSNILKVVNPSKANRDTVYETLDGMVYEGKLEEIVISRTTKKYKLAQTTADSNPA